MTVEIKSSNFRELTTHLCWIYIIYSNF